ncbi:hypothetical protein H072_10561 [Dactylellina haptotyla CBS 200.50]|uniref:Extracellular serine-rich protein n=1 Tax=Dactylellina haptotyla (strain CBS 200.50) TaxID=1284197 RepID=S7ZZR8_DACHA|nr:hypothetical protein H072_10561 [Dactylellina haptotyla CBS 200.50]
MWFNFLAFIFAVTYGVGFVDAAATVNSKVLILATDNSGSAILSTLDAYGIPYDNIVLPSPGYNLSSLYNSDNSCKYGAIVMFRQLWGSDSSKNWVQWVSSDQIDNIYAYQVDCGVRLVHLGAVPGSWDFGCTIIQSSAWAENDAIYGGNQQFFLEPTVAQAEFPTANLKNPKNAHITATWHTPGLCADDNLSWGMTSKNVFLYTEAININSPMDGDQSSYAHPALGVINRFDTGREHMGLFSTFAQWSEASIYMNHIWINWAFRGIIPGHRSALLGLQVDDLLLPTAVYSANYTYRLSTSDVVAHAKWQVDLNSRLTSTNPGSEVFLEFGFNGNGAFIYDQTVLGLDKNGTCPVSVIYTAAQPVVALEYVKPPGTGVDLWPTNQNYSWPDTCIFYDPIAKMFSQNNTGGDDINGVSDYFALVSHTFTHEGENPITYADAVREIQYNQQFQKKSFFDKAKRFSPNGIIPPAITGLHNADAIKAWMENGIKYVVGDNTRPPLRNQKSDRWPLVTTAADNGYPGLVVIPRWSSRIYYNADGVASDVQEWLDVSPSQATNSMFNLLSIERATTAQYLLGLYHDPFMFHQANLRMWADPGVSVNGVAGPWSLIQMWTESILDEFTQYVNWPIKSLKHDDLGKEYVDRMNRDLYSNTAVTWITSDDKTTITGIKVSTGNSSWSGEVPVMIPTAVVSTSNARVEQIGSEPTVLWVSNFPASYTFKTPIKVKGTKVNATLATVSLTTTLPTLSLPTSSVVGSFPVSVVASVQSTAAASASISLSLSLAASAATANASTTSTAESTAESIMSTVETTSSSAKATSTSIGKTTSTSTGAASSSTDVAMFLDTLCGNSATASSLGSLCQLWSAFKSTGKISRRAVLPEGAAEYEWDFEGGHPEEKRKRTVVNHRPHKRSNRHP